MNVISLRDALPEASIIRLHDAGFRLDVIQNWLNNNEFDYCTAAPNIMRVACAVHDYLCRTKVVSREAADLIFFHIMMDLIDDQPDELVWEWLGRTYAHVAWFFVHVHGILAPKVAKAREFLSRYV